MTDKNYQIIELKAENVLNLKAVRIRPEGKSVVLTGDNEAGKSNVLNAIFMALAGDKAPVPIRKGEERGEVSVDLGDILVKKVYTQKGERLEVTNAEGAVFRSPQTLLNNILGRLTFNPIEFAELSRNPEGRRRQRQILVDMLGLDFEQSDAKIEELKQQRAEKRKTFKNAEALLGEMDAPGEGLPDEELSLKAELEKVEALEAKQEAYLDAVAERENHTAEIEDKKAHILELEKMLAEAREDLVRMQTESISIPEEVTSEQVLEAKEKLGEIEHTNKLVRQAKRYRELQQVCKDADDVVLKFESEILDLQSEKNQALAQAKFPVEGLGFDEENVTFNGLPFSQQSTARQLILSTAICMELNPKLRVILLRDASVVSSGNLNAICEMAEKNGYQVWIERVDDSGKVGFYIEDGEVKAINGKEVQNDDVNDAQ